jgi:carboxyl-terminal processing protease
LVQSVRGLSDGSGLTVTIAKYLTPSGTDIHKNGIKPDVKAMISNDEIKNITLEQLGTEKDSQYVVAETTLIKAMRKAVDGIIYDPKGANLSSAL